MADALLLGVPAAAEVVGLGRAKFYELLQRGDIPSVRIGRRLLVSRRALEEYVTALEQQYARRSLPATDRSGVPV